jgi:hypothetical protein
VMVRQEAGTFYLLNDDLISMQFSRFF